MDDEKLIRFPTTYDQRWRNRHGIRAVPCIISDRWIQLPEKASMYQGSAMMFVDVMTGDGENARKLCQICISKEDLITALAAVEVA